MSYQFQHSELFPEIVNFSLEYPEKHFNLKTFNAEKIVINNGFLALVYQTRKNYKNTEHCLRVDLTDIDYETICGIVADSGVNREMFLAALEKRKIAHLAKDHRLEHYTDYGRR